MGQGELQTAQGHSLGWGVAATGCAGVCRLEKDACKETELHLYRAASRSSWPSLAFAFLISFILRPPSSAFYGRIEEFSVSGSAIFLCSILTPIKTSGGSCLVVRCSSNAHRAEGPGSHEATAEAVLGHTRGLQAWAVPQLLAANGGITWQQVITWQLWTLPHQFGVVGRCLWARRVHRDHSWWVTSSLPAYDEVLQKEQSVLALSWKLSDVGCDLLSYSNFADRDISKLFHIKHSVKYNGNK